MSKKVIGEVLYSNGDIKYILSAECWYSSTKYYLESTEVIHGVNEMKIAPNGKTYIEERYLTDHGTDITDKIDSIRIYEGAFDV